MSSEPSMKVLNSELYIHPSNNKNGLPSLKISRGAPYETILLWTNLSIRHNAKPTVNTQMKKKKLSMFWIILRLPYRISVKTPIEKSVIWKDIHCLELRVKTLLVLKHKQLIKYLIIWKELERSQNCDEIEEEQCIRWET